MFHLKHKLILKPRMLRNPPLAAAQFVKNVALRASVVPLACRYPPGPSVPTTQFICKVVLA